MSEHLDVRHHLHIFMWMCYREASLWDNSIGINYSPSDNSEKKRKFTINYFLRNSHTIIVFGANTVTIFFSLLVFRENQIVKVTFQLHIWINYPVIIILGIE